MDCIFSNHCYQQWLELKNCSSKHEYFVNIKSDLFSIFLVKKHNTPKWPQNSYIFLILEPIGTFVHCKKCSPPNMANKMSLNSYVDHHICLIFQIWLHNNASWQKGHLIVHLAYVFDTFSDKIWNDSLGLRSFTYSGNFIQVCWVGSGDNRDLSTLAVWYKQLVLPVYH